MRKITPIFTFSFFCFFSFLPEISIAEDILTSTGSMTGDGGLISSGGTFKLGFFKPGSSKNRYLGVWYNKVSIQTVVWVANRDKPLTNSSGVFKIGDQGNAIIVMGDGSLSWSSNHTKAKNPVIQLLESGNLVLREEDDDDPENFLWQSFDYPSDTLLPGMKLGYDLRTGLDRYIRSWKSIDDPSPGESTYRLDHCGMPESYLLRGSVVKYRSGPWNGIRFSGVPEMQPGYIFQFSFESNKQEIYFKYDLIKKSLISRLTVSPSGLLQRFTWLEESRVWNPIWRGPKDECDDYAVCGPFGVCNSNGSPVCECLKGFLSKSPQAWFLRDGTDGCVRTTPLACSKADGFMKMKRMKLPDTEDSIVYKDMNLNECEDLCLKNCSCMGYASADIRGGGSGCVTWGGQLIDLREYGDSGQDLYVRLAGSDLDSDAKKRVAVIVAATVVPALLLLAVGGFCLWNRNKRKDTGIKERRQDLLLFDMGGSPSAGKDKSREHRKEDLELPLLDLGLIVAATNNFSDSNKLGEGGFGPVYKGKLEDDQEIAVKRLSKRSGQGIDEFKNEVTLIAKLQHRNLVRLLACCIEGEEKILIYEYMPNKSLDFFLFVETKKALLDWEKRFDIIMGIARGLLYLHQDSRLRIIHRDLKAGNILLDSKMNPKISDFGMARIFGGDETEANTKRVVGTYGYMSPEYAMDGLFSVKSDVFSFGVLVLEIVSGKKNRGFYQTDDDLNLLALAWRLWKEGKGSELMDASIEISSSISTVLRCIQVGLLCVQESAEDRPSMSTVVLMLGSDNPTLPPPKQPGFCTGRSLPERGSFPSQQESYTINQVTVTMLEAR
ncbi:receptor-like serine/threonine-protein kinase SD1-8 [Aristolochia californica]|uniref:receptor-like serine/threonine-protein kinase SD1-8 n=1 Tax=Aristolochia californica TaxID=171875 RepID=UPI0035D907B1